MIVKNRLVFTVLGWFFLALGVIGIFLPIMPTTPFVLLAALCFSRGSQRLHEWLLSRPYLGAMVVDWEQHGVIRKRAKWWATLVILPLFGYSLVFVPVAIWIKVLVGIIGAGVLIFIWTRPAAPGATSAGESK